MAMNQAHATVCSTNSLVMSRGAAKLMELSASFALLETLAAKRLHCGWSFHPMRFPTAVAACALALPLLADEGMWLFNQFPKDQVKQRYGFDVTDGFLEHLRLAAPRVGS